MDKFKKNIYIPLIKVDEDQRMVYGYASTPSIDSDNEIIETSAIEKALPQYLKFPTIREMHQPRAVGKTTQADVSKKGLYIGAKVVTDEAWKLVKEGVYKGFSVGGNVLKRIGNRIKELELLEISLVDVPANKAAVIEVWKRGKLSKDAETAYSMANLMIRIKDMISYFEYEGKDTKKLEKILEMVKSILASEASEAEESEEKIKGLFIGTPEELDQKIALLEKMDFSDNPIANSLRKGVILNMKTAKEELNKNDDQDKEKPVVEQPKNDEKKKTPEGETPQPESTDEKPEEKNEENHEEHTETPESEAGEHTEEQKETGSLEVAMQKIAEVEKRLTKLAPEDKKEAAGIVKAVGSLASSFAKMAGVIEALDARLQKVEAQPAKPKSKAVTVFKNGEEPDKKDETDTKGSLLEKKKARLEELKELHASLGAAKYAKAGYSMEAGQIIKDIAALQA